MRKGGSIGEVKNKTASPQSDDLRQTKIHQKGRGVGWKHKSLSEGTK